VSAVNRLGKWRAFFAGWQLGTRLSSDPESQAVRDHREATLILRAEVSALTALLIQGGAFSGAEFLSQLEIEAEKLSESLSERFPGVTATEGGLTMDLLKIREAGTMDGWLP
jgi:hypothetical protein